MSYRATSTMPIASAAMMMAFLAAPLQATLNLPAPRIIALPPYFGTDPSQGNALTSNGLFAVGASNNGAGHGGATLWRLPQDSSLTVQTTLVNGITQQGGSAFDASADGSVVVGLTRDTSGTVGFRWTQSSGVVTVPQTRPGGNFERCSADGAVVVGTFWQSSQAHPSRFLAATNTVEQLGVPGPSGASIAISDNSQTITGNTFTSSSRTDGFVWRANSSGSGGTVTLLPLPAGSTPSCETFDLSANGLAVVGRSTANGGSASSSLRPTLWTHPSDSDPWALTQLPLLPGLTAGYASVVNGDGTLALGFQYTSSLSQRTNFIWTSSLGTMPVAQFLSTLNLPAGWHIEGLTDVSADGQTFLGTGTDPQGRYTALVLQLPSPGSAMLLAMAALAAQRRRRGNSVR